MTQTTSTSRLRPFKPTPFGRYTLLLPLSTGGMGEIFLARMDGARGFDKLCVIKRILPHLAQDTDFVTRFVNEAKTLAQLSHGSIAQILDFGMVDGTPFLAIEWVDGKDLRRISARMRDRNLPMPLTFVLFVMSRVLDALAYAHRKRDEDENEIGLVHRDVSPQNVLISYEGEVKVIDFGLAKSTLSENRTNPSIVLGKFLYMSPEQATHQTVDRRSDLYAVGICLYEMIAGKNPFDEIPPGELMAKVAAPTIRPLNHAEPLTPPAIAQVVMRALNPDPGHRFQTAEEFRGRLMACLLDIDSSAGPESASRFMRDAFGGEHQAEKKLHAQLRDALKPPEPEPDTAVHLVEPPAGRPVLEPVPPRRDVSPLSFKPTPTSRAQNTDFSDRDRETMPGVMGPEGFNKQGEAETGQVGVVAEPRASAPKPHGKSPPVEHTEPSGVGLQPVEARPRASTAPTVGNLAPVAARVRTEPHTDSTDPSLLPVASQMPRRQEITKPIAPVAMPSAALATPAEMPAATPLDTLPPSGEQPVVVTPQMPLFLNPLDAFPAAPAPGPRPQSSPDARATRPLLEAKGSAPVVERVPRALEKSAPPMTVDTQRTKSSRPSLLIIIVPLIAVLGAGGYIGWDLWTKSNVFTESYKEQSLPKPTPEAPKRREPEPAPPEPKPKPDDPDLVALEPNKPKPTVAPKKKVVSQAARALDEVKNAIRELDEAGGKSRKFGLRVNILEEKLGGKMGENEEAVFLRDCEKLRGEINKAKADVIH